ncbi:MAG: hypothetical protein MJE77_08995 [Proteobacteria bacterium]|nr:hypothetical protein [Pseudomonadota bacterium]
MKNWLYPLVFSILALLPACGSDEMSPADVCNDIIQVSCERLIECYTDAELEQLGAPKTVQGCVDARKMMLKTNTGLACEDFTVTTSYCMSGQTYSVDNGSLCIDILTSATCESYKQDASPGACNDICI